MASLVFAASLGAQSIANGDFELMDECPPFFGPDVHIGQTMESWIAVQGTADGYHDDCPAMAPAATPGVPAVQFGLGYGALWGPGEVFGQLLDAPLDANKNYCVELRGIAVDLSDNGAMEGDPCLQLCLYGSTVAPPPVDPWSVPMPVEDMPGTTLLTCSEALSLSEWTAYAFSFIPEATYPVLFFASKQDPGCNFLQPYLCVDNIVLTECVSTGMDGNADAQLGLHPNPASESVRLGTAWTQAAQVRIHDLQGRLMLETRVADPSVAIPLDALRTGSYLLSAYDRAGTSLGTQRLQIQR